MLRMDPFLTETPATVDEAVALLAAHHAAGRSTKVIAGGTDVVPNLKHGLFEPEVIVHIGRVAGLKGVVDDGASLVIGALTTLHDLAADALVLRHAPGLARAAGLVAGPQLRRMGTLGGNIALDTRCLFYNQTYFWREALGFCLKKDGNICHVIAGGKKCVAAASNDTATMLLCLDAEVVLQGPAGRRTMKLEDFYVANGIKNTVLDAGDLLVQVRVPKATGKRLEGYAKLRHRNAIDYPLLSVGVRVDVDAAGLVTAMRCVVSALQARPHKLPCDAWIGKPFGDDVVEGLKQLAFAKCVPVKNLADDVVWRREMVPVLVQRAFDEARGVAS
ncbi:MAG: FAD binding domain-containing protein [Deltaproteobacteria bacterium]|nr:FAD binding domain-containing protein [Deltaproteobacteria bacterium]